MVDDDRPVDDGPQSDASTGPDHGTPPAHGAAGPNLNGRLFYLFSLLRRGDAQMRHGHPRGGVFQGQGRVLRLLSLHSPIAQKDLAYLLGIRSQSLSELLGKLEEADLVRRHPHPDDRRTTVVELTDTGRAASADDPSGAADDPFAVLDPDEQRRLADLLDRVIDSMEDLLPDGPDPQMQRFKQMAFGGWGPGDMPGGRPGGFHGRGVPFGGPWFADRLGDRRRGPGGRER